MVPTLQTYALSDTDQRIRAKKSPPIYASRDTTVGKTMLPIRQNYGEADAVRQCDMFFRRGHYRRARAFLSGFRMRISSRSAFPHWSTRASVTDRTAVYGPVRTVAWQGSAGDRPPYAEQFQLCFRKHNWNILIRRVYGCTIQGWRMAIVTFMAGVLLLHSNGDFIVCRPIQSNLYGVRCLPPTHPTPRQRKAQSFIPGSVSPCLAATKIYSGRNNPCRIDNILNTPTSTA
jgi:hypothetical protein